MASGERTISDVFQDIVHDIQEIVRSEVRLARTEIREEAVKARSAGILLGGGAVVGLYAGLLILTAIVAALSLVMAVWAAALIVGLLLAAMAAGALTAGRKELQRVHPKPERTVDTLRENAEWIKQQTR